MFLSRNIENITILSENFQFLVVKFSIYFNRPVFVMGCLANLSSWIERNILSFNISNVCKMYWVIFVRLYVLGFIILSQNVGKRTF